jgi:hypothetical protein
MKRKIAFGLYLLSGLVLLGFGLRYFFAGQLMPYHAETMGVTWESLSAGHQLVFLTLYRATGTGMLVSAVALLVLLLVPFRQGKPWARWALTGIGLLYGVLSVYLTLVFQAGTTAAVPWQGPVASVVAIAIAHILSAGSSETQTDEV